jgi:hypothetical protein
MREHFALDPCKAPGKHHQRRAAGAREAPQEMVTSKADALDLDHQGTARASNAGSTPLPVPPSPLAKLVKSFRRSLINAEVQRPRNAREA